MVISSYLYILHLEPTIFICFVTSSFLIDLNFTTIFSVMYCDELQVENSVEKIYVRAPEDTQHRIRCQAGYVVVQESLITCKTDGFWSSVPECWKMGKKKIVIFIKFLL